MFSTQEEGRLFIGGDLGIFTTMLKGKNVEVGLYPFRGGDESVQE